MNPNLGSLPVKASIIIWGLCCSCKSGRSNELPMPALPGDRAAVSRNVSDSNVEGINPYPAIGMIPLPAGYHRITALHGSFAEWLRNIALKRDRTVRLYDGSVKSDQESQFAVLDVSVGKTDLQQCADAVMRLRAEWLYSRKEFKTIEFRTAQGTRLNFGEWAAGQRWRAAGGRLLAYKSGGGASPEYCADRKCFWNYLQTVFAWCGTLTLEKQLELIARNGEMQIGDVFIRGGSPGHAMLVVDMAANAAGRKIFLLAQSYMPAQDIHIVRNLKDASVSPWYSVDYDRPLYTPAWTFYPGQLRTWPTSP